MCASLLNFIYIMYATIKQVTDSDKHMFYLLLLLFFIFILFFGSCSLLPLIVRFRGNYHFPP
jgi:hypothetical protein